MAITKKTVFILHILNILLLFILAANAGAFRSDSSNYILFPTIVSSGGDIVNSSSFKNYVATGIISEVINSSNFKNFLGFYYAWLLANGQPCTANNQCEGGFCCSNACQSSSCPVEGAGAAAPSGAPSAAGAGGGGAVIPKPAEKDFSLSESAVKAELTLGEEKSETMTISNTGEAALYFSLSVDGEIKEFLTLSDSSFSLGEGESKIISLDFTAKRVGSFVGQVIVKGDGIEKSILISIGVESEISLFDVKLDIPQEFKKVLPGDILKAQITLLNIGTPKLLDVIITYFIKDLSGNIVYQASETLAVEAQKSFVKDFPINKDLRLGSYVAIIELRYANSFAVSSDFFEIVEEKPEELKQAVRSRLIITLSVIILIAALSLAVLFLILKQNLLRKF